MTATIEIMTQIRGMLYLHSPVIICWPCCFRYVGCVAVYSAKGQCGVSSTLTFSVIFWNRL